MVLLDHWLTNYLLIYDGLDRGGFYCWTWEDSCFIQFCFELQYILFFLSEHVQFVWFFSPFPFSILTDLQGKILMVIWGYLAGGLTLCFGINTEKRRITKIQKWVETRKADTTYSSFGLQNLCSWYIFSELYCHKH